MLTAKEVGRGSIGRKEGNEAMLEIGHGWACKLDWF
jgi:hypothetical protein